MDAEIELKLFFEPQHQNALITILDSLPECEPKGLKRLSNGYFDTPDLTLRRWDMGLRVRGFDGHREQTIKTAGRVVGGIHSRPEYNVTIEQDFPTLALFPAEIWPKGSDIEQAQSELACVFNTDFARRCWHVQVEGSRVEVALDIGQIRAGSEGHYRTEALCELEFELLSGKPDALLMLASRVANSVPLRLGKASKAQRGYRLAAQSSPLMLEALDFIALPKDCDLTQAFASVLETGIERWQLIEAMIADSVIPQALQTNAQQASFESSEDAAQTSRLNDLALPALWTRLRACIRLLKLTLNQFGVLSETNAAMFAEIEQQLAFIEPARALSHLLQQQKAMVQKHCDGNALIEAIEAQYQAYDFADKLRALWAHLGYGQLQLSLVTLLHKVTHGEVRLDIQGSVAELSDALQQSSWEKIIALMPVERDLTSHDYQAVATALDESILVGFTYGALYSPKLRDQFRAPWLDLVLGIQTLMSYQALASIADNLGLDLTQWLDDKTSSLLNAMEYSRKSALTATPYWQ